jgi:hypothetical protein
MAVPQIVRTAHGGVRDSDLVRLFGRWNGNFVLTAHEAVLFEMPQGGGQPTAVHPNAMFRLIGASCVTVAGLEVGSVAGFDNPAHTPSPVSPVVRLSAKPEVNYLEWRSTDAVPINQIQQGLAIRLHDTTVIGEVTETVEVRTYLASTNPTSVRAAVLRFGQNMANMEGTAVVVDDDGSALVGMLFNLSSGGGQTLAYCVPAALFA